MKKTILLFIGALTLSLAGCGGEDPAPHVHNYQKVDAITSTCLVQGEKEHYHCEGCDKDFLLNEETEIYEEVAKEDLLLPLDSHEYVTVKSTASCQHDGKKEHYKCSKCKTEFLKVDGEYVVASDEDLYEAKQDHNMDTRYGFCKYNDCTEPFDSNYYDFLAGGKQVFNVSDHKYRFYVNFDKDKHSIIEHQFEMRVYYYTSASDPDGHTIDSELARVYMKQSRNSSEDFVEQYKGFSLKNEFNFFTCDFKYSQGKYNDDSFVKFAVEIKCLKEAHFYGSDNVCIDCGHHLVAPEVTFNDFGSQQYNYSGSRNQIISFVINFQFSFQGKIRLTIGMVYQPKSSHFMRIGSNSMMMPDKINDYTYELTNATVDKRIYVSIYNSEIYEQKYTNTITISNPSA